MAYSGFTTTVPAVGIGVGSSARVGGEEGYWKRNLV